MFLTDGVVSSSLTGAAKKGTILLGGTFFGFLLLCPSNYIMTITHRYDSDRVKDMIGNQKKKYG